MAGDLIGTSDARGCGVNFGYDAAGRLVTEDYAPCEPAPIHAPYSKYVPEVVYWYDFDDLSDAGAFTNCPTNSTAGRLVSVTDRSGKTMTCYDRRGRTVEVARQLTDPDGNRTGRWYHRQAEYDAADRSTIETTGAGSQVETSYTQRGTVKSVGSSHGTLVERVAREPDGLVTEIKYGDGAHTTTSFLYDDLRRLHNQTTYRASFGPANTLTTQMLLQDEEFVYDKVGNPIEIRDWRIADEWPSGSKPVTRKMRYDDLYRLVRMDYEYTEGSDTWTDPYAAEQAAASLPDNKLDRPMPRADFGSGHRVLQQSWSYDWLGNTAATDDDQHAFWDRSLGVVQNGTPDEGAYKLKGASNTNGSLTTDYDAAGNLIELTVDRAGMCVGAVPCGAMHFVYVYRVCVWGRRERVSARAVGEVQGRLPLHGQGRGYRGRAAVLREEVLRTAASAVGECGPARGARAWAGGPEPVCVCAWQSAGGGGPGGVGVRGRPELREHSGQ